MGQDERLFGRVLAVIVVLLIVCCWFVLVRLSSWSRVCKCVREIWNPALPSEFERQPKVHKYLEQLSRESVMLKLRIVRRITS